MKQEANANEFHDSESEDIFDLYNACNGVLHNGLLDISKLEEYTPAEAEELNVAKLREIWAHAADCSRCNEIVAALNNLRGALKETSAESKMDLQVT